MKKYIKQEKGVTLVALAMIVIILIMITTMLVFNAKDSIYIKNLYELKNDISNLRDKVSEYYNEYGKIPASVEYAGDVESLGSVLNNKEKSVNSIFYVLDLQAMKGISLNYGKDYEYVKNTIDPVTDYEDIYIINNITHNIFYVGGIKVKEGDTTKMYYTDYTEPDNTFIDFRYVDGVKIPDGYYFIGKTEVDGKEMPVISANKDEEIIEGQVSQYIWTEQENKIENLPDGIQLESTQSEEEFVNSVNKFKGYFKNSENKVVFVRI